MEKGFIISLILAGMVGFFALSNGDKVVIDLIFTKVFISQAIVIFISAFLGAIIVAFMGLVRRIKYKRNIKDINRKLEHLEEENTRLNILLNEKDEIVKVISHKEEEPEDIV